MIQLVSESRFKRAFDEAGRGDNFTPEGRRALFEYIEAYEQETGETITVDAIALCSEYAEYTTASEAVHEYGIRLTGETPDDRETEALQILRKKTTVIPVKHSYRNGGLMGVIVQNF